MPKTASPRRRRHRFPCRRANLKKQWPGVLTKRPRFCYQRGVLFWPKGSPASRFPTLSVPRPPRLFSAGAATSSLPLCAFVASPLARLEVLARSKSPPGGPQNSFYNLSLRNSGQLSLPEQEYERRARKKNGPPNSEQFCPQAVQPSASKWGAAGIAQRVDREIAEALFQK